MATPYSLIFVYSFIANEIGIKKEVDQMIWGLHENDVVRKAVTKAKKGGRIDR